MMKRTNLILDTNQIIDDKTIERIKNVNKKTIVLGNYST